MFVATEGVRREVRVRNPDSVRCERGRLQLLQQLLAVGGRVVLDHLLRVGAVDDLDGLAQLAAGRLRHLLHGGQAAAVHEGGTVAWVVGQDLANLCTRICEGVTNNC